MTDPRGRSARWTGAVLAAPLAAGLFVGTTVWAAGHDPLHPTAASRPAAGSPSATRRAHPAVDPAAETLLRLRAAIVAREAYVASLGKQVSALRAETATLVSRAAAASAAAAASPAGAGYTAAGSSSATSSAGSAVAAAAPQPAAV